MNPLFIWASTGLWAISLAVWLAVGVKRFWSPWLLYLVFHLMSFVIRPWIVHARGDQDYLHNWVGIPTTWADHEWALVQALIALLAISGGCYYGENRAGYRPAPRTARMLDPRAALLVGCPLVVMGFISLLTYGQTPWSSGTSARQAVSSGGVYTSISTTPAYVSHSYLVMSGVFLVWVLVFGLRWIYFPLLAVFFFLVAYQETARTTYFIGVLALVVTHLVRNGRSRPSLGAAIPIVLATVSFISGKQWLYTIVNGSDARRGDSASVRQNRFLSGEGEFFLNYEWFLMTTYAVPRYAEHTTLAFYGRMIYQFVPRALWSQKPIFDTVGPYLAFEVPGMNTRGLTVTLPGEAYVAFGPPGVFIVLFAFAFGVSYVFRRSLLYPPASVECALGIAACMACFQVYRDGLISLTTYGLYYGGPALMVWGVSLLLGTARREAVSPAAPDVARAPTQDDQHVPTRQRPAAAANRPARGIHARRAILAAGPEQGSTI